MHMEHKIDLFAIYNCLYYNICFIKLNSYCVVMAQFRPLLDHEAQYADMRRGIRRRRIRAWYNLAARLWPQLSRAERLRKLIKYFAKGGHDVDRYAPPVRENGSYIITDDTEFAFNEAVYQMTSRGIRVPHQLMFFLDCRDRRTKWTDMMRLYVTSFIIEAISLGVRLQ